MRMKRLPEDLSKEPPGDSTKSRNKAERTRASQRAAEIRKAQERKERRRRNAFITAAILAVLAVIVGVGYAVQTSRDTTGEAAASPAGAVSTYGIPRGVEDAPVTVTIFEDFLCPVCGTLEAELRPWINQYVEDGNVRLVYRPIAILDRYSNGTEFPTRAANALAVVFDTSGSEVAGKFHDLLFENQPEEGTDGLSDDQLVDLAVQAGAAEADVRGPIDDRDFEQWVVNATGQASKDGVTGTPTVEVDGDRLEPDSADAIAKEIRERVDAALE
jgi:protein-disulfide isomerase